VVGGYCRGEDRSPLRGGLARPTSGLTRSPFLRDRRVTDPRRGWSCAKAWLELRHWGGLSPSDGRVNPLQIQI